MNTITWDESFSVGVKEIDSQHTKLFDIINRLLAMYDEHPDTPADLAPIFNELLEYANYHFTTEENYFRLFSYDQAAPHIEMHEQYRQKMKEFKDKFDQNQSQEAFYELTNYLKDWWVWHINHTDKEYTTCFKEHGLE